MANDFLRNPAGECVAGNAGKRIRATALKREAQRAGRLGGAAGTGDLGQPPFDESDRSRALLFVAAVDAVKGMEHVSERVVAALHEPSYVVVGVRARAVVGREHRAHVGVHHEPREHAHHMVEIVRAADAAAFGVGHRDHAVDSGRSHARGTLRNLTHESVGAGRGGEHHDEVAGPHPAPARTAVSVECRTGVGAHDLLARHERRLIQLVGLDGVHEVRGRWKLEVDVAFRQRGQDLLVADVLSGIEVAGRDAERESPRGEVRTLRNRRTDEAVSFEDGVGKPEFGRPVCNHGARFEAPRRNRDVVSLCRHAGHVVEFETIEHDVFPGSIR